MLHQTQDCVGETLKYCAAITTNNRYTVNMSNHALNKDDGAYLPEEYMHLIGR